MTTISFVNQSRVFRATYTVTSAQRGLKLFSSIRTPISVELVRERSLSLLKMGSSIPIRSASTFPNSYPHLNPVDAYREHISSVLGPIVGQDPKDVYPKLQWTQELKKGDLTLAAPALQIKGTKPQELATKIGEHFQETDLVEKPVVNGIHIQFFFKPLPLTKKVLPVILKDKTGYGANHDLGLDPSTGRKKKIIVEFSSPNIAKPFHAGHLRSTIIGGFIAKLYQTIGWDVYKMNYL